jgi:catecholate siderophore receptor
MDTGNQTRSIYAALALTATMGVGQAGTVLAEETPLEEIVVQGKYLSIDKVNSVKTPTPILDVPQSLTILTSEQMEKQAFQNLGDVVRYTPGLSVSQGEGHRDSIIIRGIQTTADFFVDGMRDDVQYYRPLYNAQQIEVLRGPNALLFGRGGGGGIVNRVQKKAELGESFTQLNASYDTFEAYSLGVDANAELSDDIALRLNAYYQELGNHRDFYEGESYAVNPTLTFRFSDATSASVSYEYVDDDRTVDRGVPSVVTAGGPNRPLENFEENFFGSADKNLTTLEAHLLRARLDHTFSDQLRGNITFQYADYDKLYQNLYPSESVVLTAGTFPEVELDGYLDTTNRENLIFQANLVGEFSTGSIEHTVLFGFEMGNQQTENARQDNVFALNGDDQLKVPFTDPLAIPAFAFTQPVRDRESEVDFISVYFQNQVALTDEFMLLLGARYDKFDIDVLDLIEQNDGDAIDGRFKRDDSEVTPRLGVIYKPVENVSIYASYSETFLPRSGEQFLTLNLDDESTRPQFFENREVGLKWDFRSDLSLTFSAFNLQRESYTSVDPADPAQLIVIEGSEIDGWELQLSGRITDNWSIIAGYADLDGKVDRADGGGSDGNATRQTPDSMFSLWNNFQVTEKLSLGIGVSYQDSFFVREDNTVEVPDFTRVDAAAFYQLNDRVRLQLNIENVTDEEYFPDAHSNNNITTGEPLNARFSFIMEL